MEAMSKSAQAVEPFDALAFAKRTIRLEANELLELADRLGGELLEAIDCLMSCQGAVIVTGMGKAGLVGKKISATLCSTGTRSFYLHPAEAIHGDLGQVSALDRVLALSMSGETEELVNLLPSLRRMTDKMIAITSSTTNTLASQSDIVIPLGAIHEADANGLAPSTSTTAMLAVGDAIAFTLSKRRGFRSQDFAQFHPGGSLGRKLTLVQEIMRPVNECRVSNQSQSVRHSFMTLRGQTRRTGAVMIVDDDERLVGVFTDSDLARLLEQDPHPSSPVGSETTLGPISPLERPVMDVMTRNPLTIEFDSLMPAAINLLAENQISELPVVDSEHRPLGLIDITDVITWLPKADSQKAPAMEASGRAKLANVRPTLLPFPKSGPTPTSQDRDQS